MEAIQYIHIDILNNKNNEFIYTKQNDNKRKVVFLFTKDGKVINLDNATVEFIIKKSDSSVIRYELNTTNTTALLYLTNEITNTPGLLPYQVTFTDTDNGSIFSTVTSYVYCEPEIIT